MSSSGGQIRRGAVLSYAAVAFNAVAGLAYTPWMVATIGAGDYGLYTLAISVINFFMLDFGLGDAVSRFLSKYYAEGRPDLANRFLGLACKAYIAVDAVILVVLAAIYAFSDSIYANLGSGQLQVFKGLYLIVAAYSVVSFPLVSFNGILVANEKFVALNGCNLVSKVLTVLFIVVALLMGAGVFALVVVNAAVGLGSSLVKYLIIRKATGVSPVFKGGNRGLAREVLGFSFWAMVVQTCQRFIFSVMPSVLAILSNTWEVAVFGLASSLEGYVWTVANALNSMFMPTVSRVLAKPGCSGELQALVVRVGRLQLYVIGGIVAAFAVLGMRFVECWVGAEYVSLYACTLLLILPSVPDLAFMVATTAIIAAGEVRARGIAYLAMAVFNIAASIPLSLIFGALGACVSVSVAYLLRTFIMYGVYSRKLGLRIAAVLKSMFPYWLVAVLVAVLVAGCCSHFLVQSGWFGFLLCCAAFVLAYAASCWLFAANEYERSLIRSLVRRLGKGRCG